MKNKEKPVSRYMFSLGIQQKDFSEETGITRATLSNWNNNGIPLWGEVLLKTKVENKELKEENQILQNKIKNLSNINETNNEVEILKEKIAILVKARDVLDSF